MMKKLVLLLMLLVNFCLPAYANEYTRNMAHDFGRGIKNVLFCWLEIPITMEEYHQGSGRPFVREAAGFSDGVFQTIERFGSGAWDFAAMLVPGQQEGLPANPETLV